MAEYENSFSSHLCCLSVSILYLIILNRMFYHKGYCYSAVCIFYSVDEGPGKRLLMPDGTFHRKHVREHLNNNTENKDFDSSIKIDG